jgi:hypothetical protein
MGQAVEERGKLMRAAPPALLEKAISLLIPPAVREEVSGDLYERCTSARHYVRDALRVIPQIILSRVRRTADPQVLLMEAVTLYTSYAAAAWYEAPGSLYESFGLLKLVVPSAIVLLAVMLEDAYASNPGKRSPIKLARGPILGAGFAYLAQTVLSFGHWPVTLPAWVMLYGSAISLLFTITLRIILAREWRTKP